LIQNGHLNFLFSLFENNNVGSNITISLGSIPHLPNDSIRVKGLRLLCDVGMKVCVGSEEEVKVWFFFFFFVLIFEDLL
jgi:ABC-type polar amino acid transport system ATPase subunit